MNGNGGYDMKEYSCIMYAGGDNFIDTFGIKTHSC